MLNESLVNSPFFCDSSLVVSGFGGADDEDDVIRGGESLAAELAAKDRIIDSLQEENHNLKRSDGYVQQFCISCQSKRCNEMKSQFSIFTLEQK